ncbi:MAG TPA: DNA internalization-related competence protein ComEC/Rec2 [Pseudomonadales bacterium]|nr:DNA internalization-related competence protein ComEC/Rec2 [Pseudomonadales bacterium]
MDATDLFAGRMDAERSANRSRSGGDYASRRRLPPNVAGLIAALLPWALPLGAVLAAVGGPVGAPRTVLGLAVLTLLAMLRRGGGSGAVRPERAAGPVMLLMLCGAGAVALALQAGARARLPAGVTADLTLTGRIEAVAPGAVGSATPSRIEVRVLACEPACAVRRVRLGLYAPLPIAQGELWRLPVRLRSPRAAANPGRGAPELRLWRRGVDALGYVRAAQDARRLARAPPASPLTRLRARLARHVDAAAGRDAPLLRALLLGDRSGLTAPQWGQMARTGTTHLFVVSGLHVGLFAALVVALLRLCGRSLTGPVELLIVLACAGAYAALTGFGLPARRALIMLAVLLAASALGREARPAAALGWAATLILVTEPLAVLDGGLGLSLVAVAALLGCRAVGGAGLRGGLRRALAAQLRVALVLAFPLVAAFGWMPVLAPLVNLVAVPVVATCVLPVGLLALLTGVAGVPTDPLLAALARLLDAFLSVPMPSGALVSLLTAGTGLVVFGVGAVLMAGSAASRALALLGIALGGAVLGPAPQRPDEGEFHVHALDVGQGLAVLVRTRAHALLFDAGDVFGAPGDGVDAGALIVAPALRALGVHAVDRLLVSHDDADHAGGVAGLLAALPVRVRHGPPSLPARDGPCDGALHWRWDGVDFEVLHPRPGARFTASNRGSCVLRVRGRDAAALLPGDADLWSERRFAAAAGPTALVVASHHGSRTSSGRALVRHSRARWVLFSAGADNAFGHPHPDVVARWQAAGACTAVTGLQGMLSWSSAQPGRLRAWRESHPAWWRWRAVAEPLPSSCAGPDP